MYINMIVYVYYISGVIFDHTDSFLGVFYVNSATYLMTSMLYAFIVYLNKYKPKWCFPDISEQLSLVDNMKGPETSNILNSIHTDNPLFSGTTTEVADDTDSSDTYYERTQ